jgi:gluconokinase
VAAADGEVVVGVDIGTTSTKAVAFDAQGQARVAGHRAYPLRTPLPGRVEQDPEEVADGACAATAEVVRGARERGLRVVGLAFSAAMHAMAGLDARGRPLTPLVTWADRRAADEAARLRAEPRGLELHRRTGTPVHPMSPLVKLRWFAEHEPETFAAARTWLGIKELVVRRLTGELVVDHGIASATGLFSLRAEAWDAEALAYAGIVPAQLPAPVPTTTVLPLSEDGAALVGLPAGTPLVVGSADGPLANLGVGAVHPGAVACSIGTSGALRAVSEAPSVDERGRVFCYVLAPGRWVVGGAVNNGGVVLDWCADALAPEVAAEARAGGRSVPEALLALAARAPAGSGGLLFLPQLLGERAPGWSGQPRACFLGLGREHRREHLLRAAVEGVCLQLAVVLASLGEAGVAVRAVRATGGFSRSALWRRILAGAFGRPIAFAASPEGSSLGAALLGMTALGMLDSLERAAELVAVAATEEPDPGEAELYAGLLPVFAAAYEALAPTSLALGRLHGG